VVLDEHDDEVVAAAVERGEVDVGFVLLPVEGPLETVELLRDPYVLVVAADSPLASGPLPPFEEIAAERLVGFRGGRSMEPVEAAIRATGREPHWAFRSNDNGTVEGLVGAGVGHAILPLLTIDEGDRRIATRDLGERVPPRLVAIAQHRDRYHSPAARAFVETAVAVVIGPAPA